MTHPDKSPAISDRDPLEVVRSAAGQARTAEIRARARLAQTEVLAELSGDSAPHIHHARESHAQAARNSARWQRMLALIEEETLLNGGVDE